MGCANADAGREDNTRKAPRVGFRDEYQSSGQNEEARTENGTDPNGWMSANYSGRTWSACGPRSP